MALSLDGTTGISASGNITGGNVIASGSLIVGSFSPLSLSTAGNVTGGNLITTGLISGGNITITTGSITVGSIINGNANGVGNIGNATGYYNTAFIKATSAQYADVAEKYSSDFAYLPGTVLDFGGNEEVTNTTVSHSTKIAGVVSTNPAYLMNADAFGDIVVEVALLGRVPCRVVGNINKGDRLVSSEIPGVAQALDPALYQPGCIIGKALELYNSDQVGTIEVVVGRV